MKTIFTLAMTTAMTAAAFAGDIQTDTFKTVGDGEEVVESGWFDREHLPEIPRHGSIARAMLDAWTKGEC